MVRFLDRLSSFCRHVWFDPRGTGASDSIAHEEGRLVESLMDDMVAVVDHLGCDRVALLGLSVPVGVLFAATHPDRTRALVLADASVRYRCAAGYPAGWSDREIDERIEGVRKGGLIGSSEVMAPSLSGDVAFRRWFDRAGRLNCSPGERVWRVESAFNADLRGALGALRVPTLVITHRDRSGARQSQYIASQIDGAKRLALPGADSLPFGSDSVASLDTVEEFLTGRLPLSNSTACSRRFCSPISSTRPGRRRVWVTDVGGNDLDYQPGQRRTGPELPFKHLFTRAPEAASSRRSGTVPPDVFI